MQKWLEQGNETMAAEVPNMHPEITAVPPPNPNNLVYPLAKYC